MSWITSKPGKAMDYISGGLFIISWVILVFTDPQMLLYISFVPLTRALVEMIILRWERDRLKALLEQNDRVVTGLLDLHDAVTITHRTGVRAQWPSSCSK